MGVVCSTLFACGKDTVDFSTLEIVVSDTDGAQGKTQILYYIENEKEFLESGVSVSVMISDEEGKMVPVNQNSFNAETNKIYTVTIIALAPDGRHKQAIYTVKGKTVPVKLTFRSSTGHFEDFVLEVPYGGKLNNIPTVPDYEKERDDQFTYTVLNKRWSRTDFSNLTKDEVIFAQYEIRNTKNRYNITFDSNGGSEVAPIEFEYGTKFAEAFPVPEKPGCGFLQWYLDENLTEIYTKDYVFTTAKTLYARWAEDNHADKTPYTFTLKDNGYEITSVNADAITQSMNLPTVYNGRAVYRVGDYAFRLTSVLEEITLPESIISLGRGCFSGFDVETSLKKVIFTGTGLREIPQDAFYNCENLEEINIPSTVTHIQDNAFYGCVNLNEVDFGNKSNLYYVGMRAFYNCSALTEFRFLLEYENVPKDTAINIYDEAFYGCDSLESMYFYYPFPPYVEGNNALPYEMTVYVKPAALQFYAFALSGKVTAVDTFQ